MAEGDSHLHDVYCIGEPWCGHVVFALASQISKGLGAVPAVRRGVLRLCRHELFRLLRSDADVIGAGRRVGRIDDLRYDGNPARQADISRRDIHARGR